MAISVRTLDARDHATVARLHARAFPHRLMSSFGRLFLARYYQAFAQSPHATALVAVEKRTQQVVGVLAGSFNPVAHHTYMSRTHGWVLATCMLYEAIRHPVLVRNLLKAGFVQRRVRAIKHALPRSRTDPLSRGGAREVRAPGILVYLVVAPEHRRQGVGAALVRRYEDDAWRHGLERLKLSTRSGENGAGIFYTRLGWKVERERTASSGLRETVYTRTLPDDSEASHGHGHGWPSRHPR